MRLTGLIAQIRPEARVMALAEQIAGDCRHAVWQRVGNRIVGMSQPAARGYTRARAAAVIDHEVDRAAAQRKRSGSTWRRKLVHYTTDAVVRMVMAQAQVVPAVATPTRRAA